MIEEDDIIAGEKVYSQFAFDAVLVEGAFNSSELENLLFEFAGAPAILPESEVRQRIAKVVAEARVDDAMQELLRLSFLGREVHDSDFRFSHEVDQKQLIDSLANSFITSSQQPPNYQIHPAFRTFLEIVETI